jgi:integrase
MEYAPDAEWRLMIALWRFAGLRAASEVLMLKWEDILWDQKLIIVRA